MQGIEEFQDLGDLGPTIRDGESVGVNGVLRLQPDGDASHAEAMEDIREVIDEHYGERIDSVVDEDEKIIIERAVILSDNLPYIEYQKVDEFTDE